MEPGRTFLDTVGSRQDLAAFKQEHWQGSFDEYLDVVRQDPKVTRTAHQRVYDMVMAYGTYEIEDGKDTLTRYRFFDDPDHDGQDSIYGLTKPLMALVNVFKSAALGYGAEKRVLLLHGPVGSSKSTIARLLKKGFERYSHTDDGALYTFGWKEEDGSVTWDPMHGEPLQLIPAAQRAEACAWLNEGSTDDAYQVEIHGDICPLSRFVFRERLV